MLLSFKYLSGCPEYPILESEENFFPILESEEIIQLFIEHIVKIRSTYTQQGPSKSVWNILRLGYHRGGKESIAEHFKKIGTISTSSTF